MFLSFLLPGSAFIIVSTGLVDCVAFVVSVAFVMFAREADELQKACAVAMWLASVAFVAIVVAAVASGFSQGLILLGWGRVAIHIVLAITLTLWARRAAVQN